jgi:peptide/nickel transport system ATP-binding protein
MVSALDVSVQATILNLLKDLQQQFGLTYLFISHDLSVIKQLCDRVMVMNNGKIEAVGFSDELYHNPPTEYVQRLIDSVPGAQFSC